MYYYVRYIVACLWLAAWSSVYGVFMWLALLIGAAEDAESPFAFIALSAFKYGYLLVIGVLPLLFLIRRDRTRI